MICGIEGEIKTLETNLVLIKSNQVTYELLISFQTYLKLQNQINKQVELFVYHSITDRSQKLFGFFSKDEKEFFKIIKNLNGIGEMTALKILSFFNANQIYNIIVSESVSELEKIPKVKKKSSEKIFFELKQNIKKIETLIQEISPDNKNESNNDYIANKKQQLAIQALIQLGFDEKKAILEVKKRLNNLDDIGELIKSVLQAL